MAEGFSELQSPEESGEVPSVATVDKVKSDEELLQEGSITTRSGTDTEQFQDTIENLTSLNGGQEHGRLVHTIYSTGNPVSDDNNRKLSISKCDDELVGQVATSSHHTCQEIINAQQEKLQYLEANMQLELELGRRLFFDDKQKRKEKACQSFRTHANEQIKSCSASGASFDFTGMEGEPLAGAGLLQEPPDGAFYMEEDPVQEPTGSAFHMEEAPEHEPRSHSTNPKILDRTTEAIPPRNHNLDKLPENPPKLSSTDNVLELHSSYKDGLAILEGDPMPETRETETCMSEDQNGSLATAAEDESQEHINQQEEELQECGTENQIPQDEFKTNSSYEGSQSPNGQRTLDRISESPVISPGDYDLDLLSERHGGCDESLAGVHMQSNEGDYRVSGTNMADSGSNMSCGNSENCGSGMDLQRQPTDKWMRCGARPKTRPVKRTPLEPSLAESLTCGLPDAVHLPVDSSEFGLDEKFMERCRSLLESQHHSSIENEFSSDASLPGASYMESMMNKIEADRIKPHTVDEVATRSDEHNRLSLSLLMRQDERGYAVGGSTFEESLDGTTGPDCTLNSDHLPSTSMGNIAHVAAAERSTCNGALNGVLSGADSTAAHPYAPGNASNLLNPAGDQVAVVSEPCRSESDSRDSMSDSNTVTDCSGINTALLALAQRIHEVCVASGERPVEGEQQREARVRAWNTRFQDQAEDFIIESLDSTPDSARALARREAVIRASTQEMRRGPSSCCRPGEHSCVCLENNGSQACRVHGTIVPERCQPDSGHDKCCKCLEDVFLGSWILPCSHRVHTECLVGMIRNGEVNCPICGHAFLQRG